MYAFGGFRLESMLRVQSETTPRVVVDIREFNSELPAVLWSHGIDIVPMPLEVTNAFGCIECKDADLGWRLCSGT